jgi:N-acyl-phosphatidylethanolamine-hydrolysing phospholipase D
MWFVPLGLKHWLKSACGVTNVVEMDWSEEATLKVPSSSSSSTRKPDLEIYCLPCQHFGGRGLTDRNKSLWCSWICSTSSGDHSTPGGGGGGTYYFGGDTAYCPLFKKIGQVHGPIDFAAIPIGAYGHSSERWFMKPVHMDPHEAVRAHTELRSRQSLGIHWGTFQLTAEPILEPPLLLKKALKAAGINPGDFVVFRHGETRSFPLRGNRSVV